MHIDIADNTMISLFKLCPRKFYWRMVEHLNQKPSFGQSSVSLKFGIAIHNSMDIYYSPSQPSDDIAISKAIVSFVTEFAPFEGKDTKGILTLMNGTDLLRKYATTYPRKEEPFTIINEHIEIGFAVSIGRYLYSGRIDKLVKWKAPGLEGYVVMDHKTSSSRGYLTTKPNSALDGYIYGASQLMKGEQVIGALLDEMYLKKTSVDLSRELTTRSKDELSEWLSDTNDWLDDINACFHLKNWRKNTNSCMSFARPCEYYNLCLIPLTQRKQIDNYITTCYDIDKWTPYKEGSNKL